MAVPVTMYWRPACPFCNRLRSDLRGLGLEVREVNIWQVPGAASLVRSIADGNETVPTVVVADRGMVNPSATQVVEAVREAGGQVDASVVEHVQRRRARKVVQRFLVGGAVLAGFGLEAGGHPAAAWLSDGAAAAAYAGFRLAAARPLPSPRSRPGR